MLGHARPCLPHPRHLAAEALGDDRLRRGTGEGRLTGQHLVQHGPEGVDIGARVEALVARRLLGAHVGRSPDRQAGLGQAIVRPRQGPRDAEVGDEGGAVGGEEQVLGLDVAVDHAVPVRVLERPGGLGGDPERPVHRQLPLPPEPIPQRLALDERHGEPELAGGLARVVDSQDVGVLQPGGELDLALEALGA